jgi:hypothetical protein
MLNIWCNYEIISFICRNGMSTDIPPLRSDQIYSGALIHTRFNLRITTKFHLKYNNLLYVSISYVVCFIIYPTSKDRKSSPDDPLIINASVVFFVCFIILLYFKWNFVVIRRLNLVWIKAPEYIWSDRRGGISVDIPFRQLSVKNLCFISSGHNRHTIINIAKYVEYLV